MALRCAIAVPLLLGCTVEKAGQDDRDAAAVTLPGLGRCPAGNYVTGFDEAGNVECAPVTPPPPPNATGLPARYRWGLEVSFLDHDTIEVKPGYCRSRDDMVDLVLTSSSVASLGSAAESDIASEEPDRWYWIWIVGDADGASPRSFLSSSNEEPGCVAAGGCAHGRLLGAVRNRDGSFAPFLQTGKTTIEVVADRFVVPTTIQTIGGYDGVYVDPEEVVPPGTERMLAFLWVQSDTFFNLIAYPYPLANPEIRALSYYAGETILRHLGAPAALPVGPGTGARLVIYDATNNITDLIVVGQGYSWGSQEPF